MGLNFTPRKRKLFITATVTVLILLCVIATSTYNFENQQKSSILHESAMDSNSFETSGVQLPGEAKVKAIGGPGVGSHVNPKKSETKKVSNANNLVQNKDGVIDEAKVMEAESKSNSDNIPLIAGNPADKKVHDKDQSIEKSTDKAKGASIPKENANVAANVGEKKNDDTLTTASDFGAGSSLNKAKLDNAGAANGIKANKNLGSETQKDVHDGVKMKDPSTKNKKLNGNNAAMEAQKNAEINGVSKDVGSSFNPANEYAKILKKSPVVIFSKSYCPYSKKLKQLLKTEYHITPSPLIIELDDHDFGSDLQKHIGEETGRFTVPNLVIDGKSRGGADDILELHQNDQFVDLFHSWTAGEAKIKRITDTSTNKDAKL